MSFFRLFSVFRRLPFHAIKTCTRNCCRQWPRVLLAQQIAASIAEPEEKLQNAFSHGEPAVLQLMDELKESIVRASEEYRNCLENQIEITKLATKMGSFSEKWDELPPMRAEAESVLSTLNNLLLVFHLIGQMAYDQSLIVVLTSNELDLDRIVAKYKEIELLILHEFELNKRKEIDLLTVKRDSILNDYID